MRSIKMTKRFDVYCSRCQCNGELAVTCDATVKIFFPLPGDVGQRADVYITDLFPLVLKCRACGHILPMPVHGDDDYAAFVNYVNEIQQDSGS